MSRLTIGRPAGSERPSRWLFLRRRLRRALRPALMGVTVAALLLAGAVVVRGAQPGMLAATLRDRLAGMTSLTVDDVVIEGRTMTPPGQLRTALGVSIGDRLLGFSLDDARARIERLTWVQNATVERRLPGTVVVTLIERRPFAVWQSGGRFQLIDRAGQVVAEQDPVKDAAAFSVLPLVVGPGAPEAAAALLDQLASLPLLRSRVVAAIRVGERRWNLRLTTGADVLLPEGNELAAMQRLLELQSSQALLDRPVQILDMRGGDRLVVRAGPATPIPPAPAPIPPTPARRPT